MYTPNITHRKPFPLLLITPALPACGPAHFDPLVHDDRMAAWLEFDDPANLPARMTYAADNAVDVNLAYQQGKHDPAWLESACAAAAEADVAIALWPLLPEADGYWANQANATQFAAYTLASLEEARQVCPRLFAVTVDMEMPYDRAQEVQALIEGGGSAIDLASMLLDGRDPVAFEASRTTFAELCDKLHTEGLECRFTGLPMLADDLADGDETLAQGLWTPMAGIDWDLVSVQVYRSLFDAHFAPALGDPPPTFTPGLIASYADTMATAFGDRAAIDLGTTGSSGVGVTDGLATAADLQADIAAALAAEVTVDHVAIYSLEGLDEHDDAAAWLAVPDPLVPDPDPAAADLRELFSNLDALAD